MALVVLALVLVLSARVVAGRGSVVLSCTLLVLSCTLLVLVLSRSSAVGQIQTGDNSITHNSCYKLCTVLRY